MSFIKLQNVSKIYSTEGNVSVGIRKINISLDIGEFVAVTGKSGCGKTTLLNVLSGLDSYEEGEMYIKGEPTSHYLKEDWEEYNSQYISFIFQDYNILESFTVLENVEFALMNITDLKERRQRAMDIVEQVGLTERANSKGSLLSGGEKQRTVIARAIAKNSPIILADEPTGNLDSKSAKEILALLKSISKDKLVVVVTHNYDDIQEYATRHIRIFDGQINQDEVFQNVESWVEKDQDDKYYRERQFIFKQKSSNKARRLMHRYEQRDSILLGVKRLTSRPKQSFLIGLVLFVALIGIIFTIAHFGSTTTQYYDEYKINKIDGRVLVACNSDQQFDSNSAKALADKYGAVDYLVNDMYLDRLVNVENIHMDGCYNAQIVLCGSGKIQKGHMPNGLGEVALRIPYNYAGMFDVGEDIFIARNNRASHSYNKSVFKIVGIEYVVDNTQLIQLYMNNSSYELYGKMERYIYDKFRDALFYPKENYDNVKNDTGINEVDFVRGFGICFDYTIEDEKLYYGDGTKFREGVYVAQNFGDNNEEEFELVKYAKDNIRNRTDVYLGPKLVEKLTANCLKSGQISLFFDDDDTANTKLMAIKSDGYSAMLASKIAFQEKAMSMRDEILNTVINSSLSIMIVLVFACVIVITLMKLMISTRSDIAIFRTMGIKNKIVKLSTYVQLTCIMLPTILLVLPIVLALYFSPIGVVVLPFMGWLKLAVLVVSFLLIIMIVGASYNKLLYAEHVRKGLRRTNK